MCYFLHRWIDFRKAEVEACASMAGVHSPVWRAPFGSQPLSPFWYLWLPSDAVAEQIADRALLIKGFLEVWGEGSTFEELCAAIRAFPPHRKQRWSQPHLSFKIVVDGWGRSISQQEQLELIDQLAFLNMAVRSCWPQVSRLGSGLPICFACSTTESLPGGMPRRFYFAREVALSKRNALTPYALPKRLYLGPTSMDHEMAAVICNLAKERGHLVYDPFVGTGSLLVGAAALGAATLGADIDIRIVREGELKSGQPVNIWSNFDAYKLQPPAGILRADAHRPPFRHDLEEVLDAVICDPPYGVRAGGRKVAPRPDICVPEGKAHFPVTEPYLMGECLRDLLDSAARLLRLGGRLSFFIPASEETYDEDQIPTHPALALVSNCEQILGGRYSRRLITLEKTSCYDAAAAWQHHEHAGPPRWVWLLAGKGLIANNRPLLRTGCPVVVLCRWPGHVLIETVGMQSTLTACSVLMRRPALIMMPMCVLRTLQDGYR
eukprot:jgi/Astpho2/3993/e_gw1.00063.101.1_t